jgi:hypothetical protein
MDAPDHSVACVGGEWIAVVTGLRQMDTFTFGAGVVGAGIAVIAIGIDRTWGRTPLIDLPITIIIVWSLAILLHTRIHESVAIKAIALII